MCVCSPGASSWVLETPLAHAQINLKPPGRASCGTEVLCWTALRELTEEGMGVEGTLAQTR